MSSIVDNGGMNADRKGMKMRNKLKIAFLLCMIIVVSLGCIESQKLPDSNETKITTSEQKLPVYNETNPLKINDTFETWSRGYYSDVSYEHSFFRIIKNYSEWTIFLDNQMLEGTLFPGIGIRIKVSVHTPVGVNLIFL